MGTGENGDVPRGPGRNVLHSAHKIFMLYIVVACILLVFIFMIVGIVSCFRPQEEPARLKAYRNELPKERVDKYESCQEETVQAFEDHNLGAAIFGSGPQAHGDLPLTVDVTKAKEPGGIRRLGENEFWNGMQFMVENQKCMDTRILLCELLLDGLCDCANSSVALLVGETPNKIKVHCDPGDLLRMVHSATYDVSSIKKTSDESAPKNTIGVSGLDVKVSAKVQAIPTIDLQIAQDSVKAKVEGSVMATIHFNVETTRRLMIEGNDLIRMPNPAVAKQRCVAFVCFGMSFQAAIRVSFIAEKHARINGSVSAEFTFESLAEVFLNSGADPSYSSKISDVNYWSNIPYAPFLGRTMQFNVSIIPMITIFTVPGIPITFMNRIKFQVNGSRADGVPPVHREAVNIHTSQYLDSFGLPPSLLVDWDKVQADLDTAVRASGVRVPKALQALAEGCNVTFPTASLDAIKQITESSTETAKLMVPNNLKKAFPKKNRQMAPRYCWNVAKMCSGPMTDPKCTADEFLYCSSTQSQSQSQSEDQPNAIPMKTMHIHPSGVITFKVYLDCDYDALKVKNKGKLYKTLLQQLKQTIAYEASLPNDDVHAAPASGEPGVLEVSIIPKDEEQGSELLEQFSHPKEIQLIQKALNKNLRLIPGIKLACPLPNTVKSVSTPMEKVCPQSFCPAGDLKMRSHGKHSFCQASGGKQFGQLQKKYFTLESCQEACLKAPNCYGIEYEYMRGVKNCELWMHPIHTCSVVPAKRDADDMKSFFECYSKCDRANSPLAPISM